MSTLASLALYVVLAAPDDASFLRGDADRDTDLNITDAVLTLNFLFLGGADLTCPDGADSDDSGDVNITDATYSLNFLFLGGPPPPEPYPEPGLDPTDDPLECAAPDCGPAPQAYSGSFCDISTPCTLTDDSVLQEAFFRNGAPSVAVARNGDVHILFCTAVGRLQGHYARRDAAGIWEVEPMRVAGEETLIAAATGSITVLPDDTPVALVNDGAFGIHVWERTGDGWNLTHSFDSFDGGRHYGLTHGSGGCLYAALIAPNGSPAAIGHLRSEWDTFSVDASSQTTESVIAISPGGEPYTAFWTSAGVGGWQLQWGGVQRAAETVVPYGSGALDRRSLSLVVTETPDGDRAHFLMHRKEEELHRLEYRRQVADGIWSTTTLGVDTREVAAENECGPPDPGATCEVEFETYDGIAIVPSSDGEVLLVYSRVHHFVTFRPECPGNFPCFWISHTERQGEIRVATLRDGELRETTVVEGIVPVGATAVLDPTGVLHIAVYDGTDDTGTELRYLRVKSSGGE